MWVDFTQVSDLDDHVELLVSMDLDGRKSSNIAAEVFLVVAEKCPVWNGNIGRVSLCFGSPLSVSYLLVGATVTLTRGITRLGASP